MFDLRGRRRAGVERATRPSRIKGCRRAAVPKTLLGSATLREPCRRRYSNTPSRLSTRITKGFRYDDNMRHHTWIANVLLSMTDELMKKVRSTEAYNNAIRDWNESNGSPKNDFERDVRTQSATQAANDAVKDLEYPNPVIVYGAHGKSGNRLPTNSLPEYLSRFFAVVMLHENFTLQVGIVSRITRGLCADRKPDTDLPDLSWRASAVPTQAKRPVS